MVIISARTPKPACCTNKPEEVSSILGSSSAPQDPVMVGLDILAQISSYCGTGFDPSEYTSRLTNANNLETPRVYNEAHGLQLSLLSTINTHFYPLSHWSPVLISNTPPIGFQDHANEGQPSWRHGIELPPGSECFGGRLYGAYAFPFDEKEQDRLDLSHHIFLLLMNGALHLAPIEAGAPNIILDLGTGTGIWAIDMANKYPNSILVGTDISKMQPGQHPSNIFFENLNAEAAWPWSDKFDFIHIRELSCAIQNWPNFYYKAFCHVKPGGFIEMQEYSSELFVHPSFTPLPADCALGEWLALFQRALSARTHLRSGIAQAPFIAESMATNLSHIGFVDVHQEKFMLPLGIWPEADKQTRELGGYGLLNMLDGMEGWTMKLFMKYLRWDEARCRELISKVKKELILGEIGKIYAVLYVVWARKPEAERTFSTPQLRRLNSFPLEFSTSPMSQSSASTRPSSSSASHYYSRQYRGGSISPYPTAGACE